MNDNFLLKFLNGIETIPTKTKMNCDYKNNESLKITNNSQSLITIKKPVKGQETIEVKQISPPSLFYDFKKSLGLQEYTDGSFILYFFFFVFTIQRLNDVFTFIKNILILPKQVTETYNFITKEDFILLDKLYDLMNQLLGTIGADRIAIAKIHNGTLDNTNTHKMKFSTIYEVINDTRIKSNKADVQNIPLEYIKEEILLGSTKVYQRIDRTDLESKCDLYLHKVDLSTKYYKLLSVNKSIYAIIEIHLIDSPEDDFLTNKYLNKRVYKISNEIETCLQLIILKRTWIQKTFNDLFKNNPVFK